MKKKKSKPINTKKVTSNVKSQIAEIRSIPQLRFFLFEDSYKCLFENDDQYYTASSEDRIELLKGNSQQNFFNSKPINPKLLLLLLGEVAKRYLKKSYDDQAYFVIPYTDENKTMIEIKNGKAFIYGLDMDEESPQMKRLEEIDIERVRESLAEGMLIAKKRLEALKEAEKKHENGKRNSISRNNYFCKNFRNRR